MQSSAEILAESSRTSVIAPAGYGKTHLIAAAVGKERFGRQLLLTHTHAGVRAIRDHQTSTKAEITQRIETMEAAIRDLLKSTAEFEREYTTKEEWVRESIFARQRLEKLTELVTRIETELENGHGVAAEMGRIATAITEMVQGKEHRQGERHE